ncbi:MAG: hypothetical protein H7Y00_00500 [Fimbriimonadaceae bacterium]|nr:hypothetical protein [Chitinophagales bacterium]
MKTLIFLLLSIFIYKTSAAQAFVYKTEEDFLTSTGEEYTSFERHYNKGMTDYASFKKGNKKIELTCNTIWGFKTEEGDLYRIFKLEKIKKEGEPLLFIQQGEFCIWLEGSKYVNEKKDKVTYSMIAVFYSKELTSELSGRTEFIEKYPQYKQLKKCPSPDLECPLEYLNSISTEEKD